MGLDTTHGCWNGAYSSFGAFRKELAEQIGITLSDYQGFGGNLLFDGLKHGIISLLDHSDCDGELSPEECTSVAQGLQQVIDGFTECKLLQKDKGTAEYFIERCERFRDGCLKAIAANETVEFH
ncbi:MAG: hypothetical protein P8J32_01495 [bacterium]|nr:hypothetical protein [bacterium]